MCLYLFSPMDFHIFQLFSFYEKLIAAVKHFLAPHIFYTSLIRCISRDTSSKGDFTKHTFAKHITFFDLFLWHFLTIMVDLSQVRMFNLQNYTQITNSWNLKIQISCVFSQKTFYQRNISGKKKLRDLQQMF